MKKQLGHLMGGLNSHKGEWVAPCKRLRNSNGNGGNCLEAKEDGDSILLRDSLAPETALRVSHADGREFIAGIKAGRINSRTITVTLTGSYVDIRDLKADQVLRVTRSDWDDFVTGTKAGGLDHLLVEAS